MKRKTALILFIGIVLAGITLTPIADAYNGGAESGDEEYDCYGGCHGTQSTAEMTMSASNLTPLPGGEVTVWVNITGGQASDSELGVMIVSALTGSGSLPSDDGWTILSDTSGITTYNYYEIDSYSASASFSWVLTAPSALGTHTLYAQVLHGGAGSCSATYSDGLVFTVSEEGDTDGDGESPTTIRPTITITKPANAATVAGLMNVTATITPGAADDPVTSATLEIVGEYVVGTLTTSPFSWSVDTTNLTDGGYVLRITAVDSTGDSVSKEIAVFVDNESETIAMLEWIVTMFAGTVAIVAVTGIMITTALYVRKRVVERRSR